MKLDEIITQSLDQPAILGCRYERHFWVNAVVSDVEKKLKWQLDHKPFYCLHCRLEKRD
jgi:hypothetical protein